MYSFKIYIISSRLSVMYFVFFVSLPLGVGTTYYGFKFSVFLLPTIRDEETLLPFKFHINSSRFFVMYFVVFFILPFGVWK